MRLTTLFTATILAGSATPVAAQPSISGEPIVQVGLFSYRSDGTVQASAYDTEPSLSSVVYVNGSLCQLGAGNRPQPAHATDAWRFAGRVVSKTTEEAVFQLEWERILENGRPSSTPGGTVQLTLKAGDQLLLDSVLPRTETSCAVASVGFEARYRTRFSEFPQLREQLKSRGGRAGAGGGGGTGAGGIAISGRGTGRGGGGGGVRTGRISAGAEPVPESRGSAPAQIVPGARMVSVNLWLVHSAPGREDEVLHQVLRAPHEGAAFAFAPVTINGPGGPATVQVTGSFAVRTNPESGGQQLIFITNRRVTRGMGEPRDATDQAGSSRIVNAMPGPDEVLSFEMPAMRPINGRPALPDRFSVRVRITPL